MNLCKLQRTRGLGLFALISLAGVLGSACSKSQASEMQKPAAADVKLPAAEALAVGVLIPGSKSDKGWMESGYDGLAAAQKK